MSNESLNLQSHFSKKPQAQTWSETALEIASSKYFRHALGEDSIEKLFKRVIDAVQASGQAQGYFQGQEAQVFAQELKAILHGQIGSFNSPVYFNVGIFSAYGEAGQGENYVYEQDAPFTSAYVRPQASACFIQDAPDDLIGIFDLLKAEAKLFKYGSGTGSNFSKLRARGEKLKGGGESTGLISYLEIFDKAAGAIKSGGTTRRAAKMVVLDADHPEILEFIHWKMLEERKARVLMANGYSGGMEGEAFRTISGQNSNNSVRVTDEFLEAAQTDKPWKLLGRRDKGVAKDLKAAEIFREMARAAWECADPGIQYHDTIQRWNMVKASGEIRSSNPCSEYMFLDDSACNLASLNLLKFLKDGKFAWEDFKQAVRILLIAQDILVDYASYPTKKIADNSHRFRPLGLGFANLGALFMHLGFPYDSHEAEKLTAEITAALHALALKTSLDLAKLKGPFGAWNENRNPALEVLKLHADAFRKVGSRETWIDSIFAEVEKGAAQSGLRNAQVTLIAPTGTIGLLMDCDTLGIEPDFALSKRKTLAGGGELTLVNQSVEAALLNLGYGEAERKEILSAVRLSGTVCTSKSLKPKHLPVFDCAVPPKGFPERRISANGHLRIMAAAQPFLSGAISKTVNLPASTRVEEIQDIFLQGWKLGLKSIAIYRDGSKSLQPLCAEC